MMPHPENHVEDIMGCTDGRGLFAGLVRASGTRGVKSLAARCLAAMAGLSLATAAYAQDFPKHPITP